MNKKDFPFGKAIATHRIGGHEIIEFHPRIYLDCVGTNTFDSSVKFKNGNHVFGSLDMALAHSIAVKYDKRGGVAAEFFCRLIGMEVTG
ncbi:MAG: hypothetical protein R8K20_11355 [Gallionellaceae bacterium]